MGKDTRDEASQLPQDAWPGPGHVAKVAKRSCGTVLGCDSGGGEPWYAEKLIGAIAGQQDSNLELSCLLGGSCVGFRQRVEARAGGRPARLHRVACGGKNNELNW
jgi:hypothetical protein